MKLCPKCGANVEGLIKRCDCCGASLSTTVKFFQWGSHEFAHGFGDNVNKIMFELAATVTPQYPEFLDQISITFYCCPKFTASNFNIKNRVTYSASRKKAILTILIDYHEYVYDDVAEETYNSQSKRKAIIAKAIHQSFLLLRLRLKKYGYCIDDLTIPINSLLEKYVPNTNA